ncbi:SH3 domain-containing protein [Acuticoccus mangrovi]|uniref:SH3 domain-containing protein n=1 Tax=Acuticoccus mangrovi TaxID=2796142 RepID=A0A934IMC1_9HYPH|nr:SH3 domain-containing protein [Acuticoccus mangrovi]MBJ3775265.1 hypothetical protein [Acuticoccus mangrovi]
MRPISLALAVCAGLVAAGSALACEYSGVRGYHQPRGNECRAAYRFEASTSTGGITFQSDGRTFFWQKSGHGPDASYRLVRVSPPSVSGITGTMFAAPGSRELRGSISSGYCGDGYITLTPIPGTCGGYGGGPRPGPNPDPGYGRPDPGPRPTPGHGGPGYGGPGPRPGYGGPGREVLPVSGRSYGGNVRARPSARSHRVAGLGDGTPIRILENTGVHLNGYDWFLIAWRGGRGYQWGGILCADRPIRGAFHCHH